MKTFVKSLCQNYQSRQTVKNVYIQQTSLLEKELHLKSNKVEEQSGGGGISCIL